jgi:hypothetical protein
MSQRIDQFCESLRQKLTMADSGLVGLKARIEANAKQAEHDVQSHLDRVRKRIEQGSAKALAARADMSIWARERTAATADEVVIWKVKGEIANLQRRAERAERYATAAIVITIAAIDEAEQASLEAWLARADADYAKHKAAD